jgi:hypothetical protein
MVALPRTPAAARCRSASRVAVIVMVEYRVQLAQAQRMGWRRRRLSLFVLPLAFVVACVVWFEPWRILMPEGERVPDDSEVLSDQAIRLEESDVFQTAAVLTLADGGLLEFRYGPISDSGVHLRRLDRQDGGVVWEQRCPGLGVGHSEYEHRVVVQIEGRTARVISRGSYGAFVERLDLDSGKRLARSVRKAFVEESFVGRVRGWLGLK